MVLRQSRGANGADAGVFIDDIVDHAIAVDFHETAFELAAAAADPGEALDSAGAVGAQGDGWPLPLVLRIGAAPRHHWPGVIDHHHAVFGRPVLPHDVLAIAGLIAALLGPSRYGETVEHGTGTGVLTTGDTFAITNSVKTSWLATVRPRVGVAIDRSLLYVTGGLAVTNISYTQTYADTLFAAVGSSSASQTKSGWTIGAGWEYAFTNNWSAKIEYLYAQFSSLDAIGGIVSTTGGTNVLHGSVDLRENIVRVGLNYRF
jgi:hypothetical protein